MKEIISAILTVVMMMTMVVFAADLPEKVEIKFNIGDTILSINGKDVEVIAPYVEGEGTTMVPIRVITEAFGATVDWNGEEEKITINYPDVKIVMTVGSKSVMVNDHTETLPEAPVVLGIGTTMVPLRFISETFAAQVSWDQETSGVKVVKDNSIAAPNKVQTSFDKEYITDSYYGWSMKTPYLQMDEISDDRRYITFGDTEVGLDIDIYEAEEGSTLEKELAALKQAVLGMTVSRAEISNSSRGERYAVVAAKDEEYYVSAYLYMKDGMLYSIMTGASKDNKKEYEANVLCAESFAFKTVKENATDISNAENGLRKYDSADFGISFSAPADWVSSTIGSALYVVSEGKSQITTYIYSESNDMNAETSVQGDYSRQLKKLNKKYSTVTEVKETVIDGKPAYYYIINTNGTKYSDGVTYDYFIKNGDYVNNFTITAGKKENINVEDIVNSIKVKDIDSQEVGNILRDSFDEDIILDYNVGNMKIGLSEVWVVEDLGTSLFASDMHCGNILSITELPNAERKSALELAKEVYKVTVTEDSGMKGVESPAAFKLGNNPCAKFKIQADDDETVVNSVGYIITRGSNVYVITIACTEEFDVDNASRELEKSILQIKWK